MNSNYTFNPIGFVNSPYKQKKSAPKQGKFRQDTSYITIDPKYSSGLKDVEQASHLIILYWGHQSDRTNLQNVTPWGTEPKGVFACRTPNRPNPIAFCVVELLEREENQLTVCGLDALDGSPVLDIKPYSKNIDSVPHATLPWFDERQLQD